MAKMDIHDLNAEAARVLALAETQLKSSIQEGSEGIAHLSHCFNVLTENHPELFEPLHEAIIALQFYDRLSQRLEHATNTVEKLGDLMAQHQEIPSDRWQSLQSSIRQSYTMETEREMFDFIMQGNSVGSTLDKYQHNLTNEEGDPENSDVSLF